MFQKESDNPLEKDNPQHQQPQKIAYKKFPSKKPKAKNTNYNINRNKYQISSQNEFIENNKIENFETPSTNINENSNINNNNNYNLNENNNFLENNINENPEKGKIIELSDLIGEKCPIEIDILNLPFNNYENSKTSSKSMGIIKSYGANTYQGLVRNYNEDRVSIIINMSRPKNYNKNYWPKTSFFGIYDGHGGNTCSEFLRDSLHKLIFNDNNYPENVPEAIKNGFKKAEKEFLENIAIDKNKENILDKSGSCAVIILIVDNKIYIANVGDSRGLLSLNNGKEYIVITEDHKPNNEKEKNRIIKNGGQVYQSQTVINDNENEFLNGQILLGPYRVLPGRLSVSRTIGDIEAKNEKFGGNPNVIISVPDIFIYDLKNDDIDFLLLGCDGIYDQMSNDEIMNCCWEVLNDNELGNNVHEKCGLIVDYILKASMIRKSFDNVTCLIVSLKEFNDINEKNCFMGKKSTQLINEMKNDFKIVLSPKEAKGSYNSVVNNRPLSNVENVNKKQKNKIISARQENSKINKISNNINNGVINNENKFINNKKKETYIKPNKGNKTDISLNKIFNENENSNNNSNNNNIQNKDGRRTDYNSNSNSKNLLNKNNINLISNNINHDHLKKNLKSTSKAKSNNAINNITNINSSNNNNNLETNSNPLKINKLKVPYEINNGIKSHYHYNTKIKSINDFSKNTNENKKVTTPNKIDLSGNNNLNQRSANNFQLKARKSKNEMKIKSTRYNFTGINSYRNNIHKKNLLNSENNYSSHLNNNSLSNNNPSLSSRSNKFRGSSSSRKKKFSYHHIMTGRLSSNFAKATSNNSMQTKIKKMSSKKFSHSKEKDIQFFLYKNKTNMAQNNNISLNLKIYNNKKNSKTNFNNKQLKNNFNKVNIGNNTGNSANNINNTKNVGNSNPVKNVVATNH